MLVLRDNLGDSSWLRHVLAVRGRRKYFRSILALPDQRKHALRWARSLAPGYLLEEPSPWLTFDAIDFLAGRVGDGARVFEYGSGGSTLFWVSLGATCVSIEHDPEWFDLIRERLGGTGLVDYRLIQPEPVMETGAVGDPSDPRGYASDDPRYRGYSFRKYASRIDEFPDGYFDLVLIDGRARPSCILHAAPKVKVGGMLVLDNAERAYYTEKASGFLLSFRPHRFAGVVPGVEVPSVTTVYVRMR